MLCSQISLREPFRGFSGILFDGFSVPILLNKFKRAKSEQDISIDKMVGSYRI
jgi:hypothetical protein